MQETLPTNMRAIKQADRRHANCRQSVVQRANLDTVGRECIIGNREVEAIDAAFIKQFIKTKSRKVSTRRTNCAIENVERLIVQTLQLRRPRIIPPHVHSSGD